MLCFLHGFLSEGLQRGFLILGFSASAFERGFLSKGSV